MDSKREEYINKLIKEIYSYKREPKIAVNTIFFGGGTPSTLTPCQFSRITDAIKDSFIIENWLEFTIEANPKTLTKEKLSAYMDAGVNRLSIGLQSKNESELGILGRIHSFSDFVDSFKIARECGIKNISVDIMYAIPNQTYESLRETLESVIALSPEHISAYSLILEEGTKFYEIKDTLSLPNEEKELEMYTLIYKTLAKYGYNHYEISNYSKSGCECKHNLKYWRNQEYIGVGASAYSYFDGVRYGNTRNLDEYLSLSDFKPCESEVINLEQRRIEFIMLALRLSSGINLREYERLFDSDLYKDKHSVIDKLISLGYISLNEESLYLTERGFYLSNSIIAELI